MADRAESILRRMALVRLEEGIVATASKLRPLELRTLDAIHLATGLSLVPQLSEFITYDARLASAPAGKAGSADESGATGETRQEHVLRKLSKKQPRRGF